MIGVILFRLMQYGVVQRTINIRSTDFDEREHHSRITSQGKYAKYWEPKRTCFTVLEMQVQS